jgi:glycine/D-amino acid oxidase-like deaminating enzyme
VRLACDVAVIGGGIIGTAAAAFLAEAGRSVVLFERAELAAGASGRNSGVLQHPYDPVLAMLHHRSLELYRELAAGDAEFSMTDKPAGILLVSPDAPVVELAAAELARTVPELAPRALAGDELLALEPGLAEGLGAVLIETGYPVVPAAATLAYGRRAARAGVVIRSGIEARPVVAGGRLTGVLLRGGERVAVGQALVAAGPWSPSVVPGWTGWPPLAPTYGVVVSVRLPDAPRHVVEELGIEPGGSEVASSFSLVNAAGLSSVGSTFLLEPPDLAEYGARRDVRASPGGRRARRGAGLRQAGQRRWPAAGRTGEWLRGTLRVRRSRPVGHVQRARIGATGRWRDARARGSIEHPRRTLRRPLG